jgi:hypothetical protein
VFPAVFIGWDVTRGGAVGAREYPGVSAIG